METLQDLEIKAARRLQSESLLSRAEARRSIANEMEEKLALDEIKILSDEEERMLVSFRRFQTHCKPGAVFKWQTRPLPQKEGLITAPSELSLVEDPQDVSAT